MSGLTLATYSIVGVAPLAQASAVHSNDNVELVVGILLFVVAGISVMDALKGIPYSVIWLLLAGLALIAVKVISVAHTSTFIREFIPAKKKFKK